MLPLLFLIGFPIAFLIGFPIGFPLISYNFFAYVL